MRIIAKARGNAHWYEDADAGGARVKGVTTLTGDGLPKPNLMKWNADATAEYAVDHWDELAKLSPSERLKRLQGGRWEKRDEAAKKGKKIHSYAQQAIAGKKVQLPDDLAGYVQSCVRFLDDFDLIERYVEMVVWNETHNYAGRLDLIGDLLLPDIPELDWIPRAEDGYATGLIDWKSGRTGIFGETALQTTGYRYCEKAIDPKTGEIIDMPDVDFCAGVWLRPDGYSLVPLESDEDILRDFLYVKEVARIEPGLRDLVGEPIPAPSSSRYVLSKVDEAQ